MLGLLLYWLVAFGWGGLAHRFLLRDRAFPGAAFAVGAAIPLTVYPALHLYLGASLTIAAYLVTAAAIAGLVIWARGVSRAEVRAFALHPVVVLPVLAGLVVAVGGGGDLDYLPYTTDEFANWIGQAQDIYMAGELRDMRNTINHPGYTPGYRLMMAFPWFFFDTLDFGSSATAPLILHVAAIGILYDFTSRAIDKVIPNGDPFHQPILWVFVLLLTAAEGMGRLWSYTLLIEPPQIYVGVILLGLFLILNDARMKAAHVGWWLAIGLVAGAGYFVKSAGLLMVIAAAMAVLLFEWRAGRLISTQSLIKVLLTVGPGVLLKVAWSQGIETTSCLSAPLSVLTGTGGNRAGLEIWDVLAVRFVDQTGMYILTYKWPVTLVAVAGWAYALWRGQWLALSVWTLFAGAYLLAIYVFHLVCFGPYYFETLNSIPRFTRVPLQMLQSIGLAFAFIGAANLVLPGVLRRLGNRPNKAIFVCLLAVPIVALGAWQTYALNWTREDVTHRSLQPVDPRLDEVHALSLAVQNEFRDTARWPVRVAFIDQGGDQTPIFYGGFFSKRWDGDRLFRAFHIGMPVSWPTDIERFADAAQQADIIWAIKIDPWQTDALQQLFGLSCDMTNGFYMRRDWRQPDTPMTCVEKPVPSGKWSVRILPTTLP